MIIIEYADVINKQISITYYPNQCGRYCASFKTGCGMNAEIKSDPPGLLISCWADGLTADKALSNLAAAVRGKTLVFHTVHGRYEYVAPHDLMGVAP